MATLKVLLNVTNDNDMGCCIVGSGLNQLCTVLCCLELYPDETWLDLQSLLIAFLVILVEKVEENRTAIRSINLDGHRSALDLLVKLYSKNARDLTSNTAQHDIMVKKAPTTIISLEKQRNSSFCWIFGDLAWYSSERYWEP